jgi:hypothetical protein
LEKLINSAKVIEEGQGNGWVKLVLMLHLKVTAEKKNIILLEKKKQTHLRIELVLSRP